MASGAMERSCTCVTRNTTPWRPLRHPTGTLAQPGGPATTSQSPEQSETPPTIASSPLVVGCRVVIDGLASRPELNGTHGIATSFDAAKGRYSVKLDATGAFMALKPSALSVAADDNSEKPMAKKRLPPSLPHSPLWRPTPAEMSSTYWLVNTGVRASQANRAASSNLVRRARSEWTEGSPPRHADGQRWTAAICGGRVMEVDLRTPAGLQAAKAAVHARRPVVMKHASSVLVPEVCAELGDVKRLGALLKGIDLTVLKARREAKGRFTYYHDVAPEAVERDRKFLAPPPVNERVLMHWDEFHRALRRTGDEYHYMQLAVAARQGGMGGSADAGVTTRVSPRILKSLQEGMRAGPLHELTSTLGPWTVSNLYCGPAGTLAPCHWDALDNTFLQLKGRKDVVMFAPETGGLRPFPHDHPYGSRSQIDLERLDESARTELAGQGALARLDEGDALFIPAQWWHHIQSSADNELAISLNFWFDPQKPMHEALRRRVPLPFPPTASLNANVCRDVEVLATSVAPRCAERATWFASMLARINGGFDATAEAALDEAALAKRNFAMQALVGAYGPEGAADFCAAYLDPRRWSGLQRVNFLEDSTGVTGTARGGYYGATI